MDDDQRFEWDPGKASVNATRHGVTFGEAETAFDDPWARVSIDERHSPSERRLELVAHDFRGRSLVVVFTYRGSTIRIISARKATPREWKRHARR